MARTKKQVLQATARKQQLHQEAIERAAKEAVCTGSPAKITKAEVSTSKEISLKQCDPYERPPGRPNKSSLKVKTLNDNFTEKHGDTNHDGPMYKRSFSVQRKAKKEDPVEEDVKEDPQELSDPVKEDKNSSPVSGPVSIRKTKLTARKSTNAAKKAEAKEYLECLARREVEPKVETGKKSSPFKSRWTPEEGFVLPPGDVLVDILDIDIDWDNVTYPLEFPYKRVYGRKSMPSARKSIRKKGIKKRLSTARKSFPPCTLGPDDIHQASTTDAESLNVFPSVHEAVITLPKSEKLPVALVCINDIYQSQIAENSETDTTNKISRTPSPRGRKSSRQASPRRSSEKAKSPRRSPKGERRSKNIFEQFQNEIVGGKSPKQKLMSPGRKGANNNVASTTFASAMKKLRSVSEKVDGKRKKTEQSPRKRSPRRTSLKLEIPNQGDLVSSKNSSPGTPAKKTSPGIMSKHVGPRKSPSPAAQKNSSPVTSSEIISPAKQQRCWKKKKEEGERRRSGSASPRGERRIRSPSARLLDENVVYMPIVKKGKVSQKGNSQDIMLTLEKTSPKASPPDGIKAARELDFMKICGDQIEKHLIEVTSEVDGTLLVKSTFETDLQKSSPLPSTSKDNPENSSDSKVQTSKQLLDLISKVDSRIKDKVFTPLENSCEEDESEGSSLNTSHNSDSLTHLIDQMELDNVNPENNTDPLVPEVKDSLPPDVKCGELYRRLIGEEAVNSETSETRAQEVPKLEQSSKAVATEPKDINEVSLKNEGCLLKKHLLSDIVVPKVKIETDFDPVVSTSSIKMETEVPKVGESSEGKKVPLWKKSHKTKEPLPLDILSKVEKISVQDKKSAFVSDELETYLESSKNLSLNSQSTPEHLKTKSSPESKDDVSGDLKDIEPDFDEVEGVLFLSFSSKDAMEAHIAVEKKNKWDKDANHLLGVSRLLAFEREKVEPIDTETPEQAKAKTPGSHNLRGQHMKWKKYRRMLRQEYEQLKHSRDKGDFYTGFQSEKTSDITKIKGWKNKFGDKLDAEASKLHWRTEERLLRNLEPDDIRALGIKKKRRKNVVFTHRKGTSKEIGYPVGRTSTYGQSGSPEEGDWNMMLDEYEEPLYGNNEGGSDQSDEEIKAINWNHSYEESLNVSEEFDVKDRPFGHAKRLQVRQEFAELFHWGEEEMKIMKNLGGRVRNRRKKNDPTDMTDQLAETESPEMKKRFRMKMKVKRTDYVPVSIITERMAIDALCALDFGKYKPTKPGIGYTDNIITKSTVTKKIQPSTLAGMKLLKKGKALLRAQEKKTSLLKSGAPLKKQLSAEAPSSNDDMSDMNSKRSCDKPGCRYGCICHLCNSYQEELEPKPQESSICNKEYCRLGCICDSLTSGQELDSSIGHCGRPECMIKCVCSKPERRLSSGPAVCPPDEGGSSDEIPSLIHDSDISAEEPKMETEKSKDDYKPSTKTWSRHGKGDKYSNLPKRESRHRVSKNLDAITRKAMMVYEASEVYCDQSSRRKKHTEEVSPGNRPTVSKISPPGKSTRGPGRIAKRKHSTSQEVHHISDDDEVTDVSSCARLSSYSPSKQRNLSGDPTVVHIENAEDCSGASSVCITPGNSRPNTPALNSQELGNRLLKVAQNPQETSKAAPPEPAKKKIQSIVSEHLNQSTWHTQMVCLKANPKPKDPKSEGPEQEGEEIKLLEFMANCNWDSSKPQILSRVAQCLSRGVYPDPKRMVISEFIVEILPKADKCAVIPPELRDKLPNSMFSIRVKVMKKVIEMDISKLPFKQAAQMKPRILSKTDSASQRIFKKAYAPGTIPVRVSQNSTTAPAASQTATSSASLGISGLSRLNISQPTAVFIDSGGSSSSNSAQVTNMKNISSVNPASESVEYEDDGMEQITVQNNETGDQMEMIFEKDPDRDVVKSIDLTIDDVAETEPEPKILKAKTGSSRLNLDKIPLSGSWDGNIDNIFTSEESLSGHKDEDAIDLTDENPKKVPTRKDSVNSNPETSQSKKINSLLGQNKFPKAVQPSPSVVKDVVTLNLAKTTPVSSAGLGKIGKSSDTPKVTPLNQILVPLSPAIPAVGPKIILAGSALPPAAAKGTRPTKTIISTPGGKLYGPFTDLNDVKRFQVQGPDGSTQPLINLLSANALPLVQSKPPPPKPAESVATPPAESNKNGIKPKSRKPKSPGKTAKVDDKGKTDSSMKPKRGRKKRKKLDQIANGVAEEQDPKPKVDETDGGSLTPDSLPTSKPQFLNTEKKLPVNRRKSIEIHLASGPSVATQLGFPIGQSLLKNIKTFDKENIDGEPGMLMNGDGDRISSQVKVTLPSQVSGVPGPCGEGPRQARSSSLDSPSSNTMKTSTPIQGAQRGQKVQGFLPIKRQRSGSESSASADASKRIKIHPNDPSDGFPGDVMTPIQKFRERMNISTIDISDDDSQMSSCSGNSLQGVNSNEVSDGEELDVETVSKSFSVKEDARDILYRRAQSELSEKEIIHKEGKKRRERARRMDILCMFMYLYNTVSKGEEMPQYETLSRQKVLDSAIETIAAERKLSAELEEELKVTRFSHRAHKLRLKSAFDQLIGSGTSAREILNHLEEVKKKEEKRQAKRKLLRKIIEYGKHQREQELGAKSLSAKSVTGLRTTKRKKSSCSKEDESQTVIEKLQTNPEIRADPNDPSRYWTDDFMIEIEKVEVMDEDDNSCDGESHQNEESVAIGTVQENESIVVMEGSDNSNMTEKLSDEKMESPECARERIQDVNEVNTTVNSGNSSSMQKSPVLGEGDENLREDSEPGTLQRSNSEEAILQVESFIENAEKWASEFEEKSNPSNECDGKLSVCAVKSRTGSTDSSGKSEQNNSGEENCTESSEKDKLEVGETIFESLLPYEVNFDDASIESVPLEPKAASCENDSEQNACVIKSDFQTESTQELTQEGIAEEEVPTKKPEPDEKFLICDVRGLAQDEFFCST